LCAYALKASVASYLAATNKELGPLAHVLFIVNYRQLVEEFFTRVNSTECHRVGMAYFNAALTVLGSPAAAYNYLSSCGALA
jgi:hypothetical protein